MTYFAEDIERLTVQHDTSLKRDRVKGDAAAAMVVPALTQEEWVLFELAMDDGTSERREWLLRWLERHKT